MARIDPTELDPTFPDTVENLIGKSFFRLTVIAYAGRKRKSGGGWHYLWQCKCECGKERLAQFHDMNRGFVKSCGCLLREMTIQKNYKHGRSDTKEYRCWYGIIERCSDKDNPHYGQQGVKMCQRYRDGFLAFLEDVGLAPSSRHSIDRVDSGGHYSCGKCNECLENGWPLNLRWATAKQQTENRRICTPYTWNGETMIISQWSEKLGISRMTLARRLKKYPPEIAFTLPVNPPLCPKKLSDADAVAIVQMVASGNSYKDAAERFGISRSLVSMIILGKRHRTDMRRGSPPQVSS